MSVVESKRRQSQFQVFHHWYEVRNETTDLMLFDFGLHPERQERRLLRRLGVTDPGKLEGEELVRWQKHKRRTAGLIDWYLLQQRNAVSDCLRNVNEEIFVANSIYPTCPEELTERRLHQDRAIGQCYRLKQELQYTVETIEVDLNRYTRLAKMIDREVDLLKAWRKSDNKFKKSLQARSETSVNFANADNNGNANCNTASNSNGVRPDFSPTT